jgi:hypothetical protein
VDIAEYSDCHRTTIRHFLSNGKWDESYLQRIVKEELLRHVVQQSKQTKEPIFVIHDDTVCKIDEVCDIADTMPTPPHKGYALVDAWYTCPKVINRYAKAGYHLIGALKTNRILYPKGIRMPLQTFASHITHKAVHPVIVNGSSY